VNVKPKAANVYMSLDRWIARWEGEGGAIPQVQAQKSFPKKQATPLRRILGPIDFSSELPA
jgi:hypothetical protein